MGIRNSFNPWANTTHQHLERSHGQNHQLSLKAWFQKIEQTFFFKDYRKKDKREKQSNIMKFIKNKSENMFLALTF